MEIVYIVQRMKFAKFVKMAIIQWDLFAKSVLNKIVKPAIPKGALLALRIRTNLPKQSARYVRQNVRRAPGLMQIIAQVAPQQLI